MTEQLLKKTFTVPDGRKPQRIDAFISAALAHDVSASTDPSEDAPTVSREKIKQSIKNGETTLNGKKCTRPSIKVEPGDEITIAIPQPETSIKAEEGPLDVLYHDQDLTVINKPAGLTVHPAPGQPEGTLAHRLLHRFPELAAQEGFRPGIVHRLDKDTSGLMLAALNERARLTMSEAFAARTVEKEYLAIVHGAPKPDHGEIIISIGRHPTMKTRMAALHRGGKYARSSYRTLFADENKRFSLAAIRIHTGRTHQVRVHMHHLGHPLFGDKAYPISQHAPMPDACSKGALKKLANRQMLHAWKLGFAHPNPDAAPDNAQELNFILPPPKDFTRLLLYLSKKLQRVAITGMPGSGKTAVMNALAERGFPVFSADAAVKALYQPGADGWTYIKNRFGEQFLAPEETDGARPIDTNAMFHSMRESDALRREITDAIHPMVRHKLNEFWDENARRRVAFAEIPLIFEAGEEWRTQAADIIVGVHCPQQQRLERVRARGWDDETFAAMESWQWEESAKMRSCDLVLPNTADLPALDEQVGGLTKELARFRREDACRLYQYIQDCFA